MCHLVSANLRASISLAAMLGGLWLCGCFDSPGFPLQRTTRGAVRRYLKPFGTAPEETLRSLLSTLLHFQQGLLQDRALFGR